MRKLPIYLIVLLLIIGACKKYEEGPLISLRSKEKRLCQEWKMKKLMINGNVEPDDDIAYYYWDIDKNGTINAKLAYVDWPGEETMTFKWEWMDNKTGIKITEGYEEKGSVNQFYKLFKNNSATNEDEVIECEIMRLTYDELIIEFDDYDEDARIEFEQE